MTEACRHFHISKQFCSVNVPPDTVIVKMVFKLSGYFFCLFCYYSMYAVWPFGLNRINYSIFYI